MKTLSPIETLESRRLFAGGPINLYQAASPVTTGDAPLVAEQHYAQWDTVPTIDWANTKANAEQGRSPFKANDSGVYGDSISDQAATQDSSDESTSATKTATAESTTPVISPFYAQWNMVPTIDWANTKANAEQGRNPFKANDSGIYGDSIADEESLEALATGK